MTFGGNSRIQAAHIHCRQRLQASGRSVRVMV
jgi:hypothetical protein